MNKELEECIKKYCVESHEELNKYLLGKSKDTLISIINDLLTMYVNDKNSSTLREFLTVTLAGYTHQSEKIGYNGFKQEIPGKIVHCEVKPKNISTHEWEKYRNNERKSRPAKLDGGGNFTDYTRLRLEKDYEANPNMLISGFIDGKLIYILEFPFRTKEFYENLSKKIEKWENKLKGSKTTKGQFLRSADFNFKDYISSKDLKIVYLLNKSYLEKFKPYISSKLYEFLWKKAR